MKSKIVPVATSPAGSCLTYDNFIAAGMQWLSYRLEDLLVRPGAQFCCRLSLEEYSGWHQGTLLDARFSGKMRAESYIVRSPLDGSIQEINKEMLLALIKSLSPDKVMMPRGTWQEYSFFWQEILAPTQLYFASEEVVGTDWPYVYNTYNAAQRFDNFIVALRDIKADTIVTGDFDSQQLSWLSFCQPHFIETDRPAADAVQGIVYNQNGHIAVLESKMAMDFAIIAPDCACTSCSQGLTRAYFHHLLQHTPLLCQRFLLEHNLHYTQHHLPEAEFPI